MEQYDALLATLALTMGASWASGINLYAALLILGIGGATGNIDLPADLQVLSDPMVILAAGAMYLVENVLLRIKFRGEFGMLPARLDLDTCSLPNRGTGTSSAVTRQVLGLACFGSGPRQPLLSDRAYV